MPLTKAQSLGSKLRCPECRAMVREELDDSLVSYGCTKCDWCDGASLNIRPLLKGIDDEGRDGGRFDYA